MNSHQRKSDDEFSRWAFKFYPESLLLCKVTKITCRLRGVAKNNSTRVARLKAGPAHGTLRSIATAAEPCSNKNCGKNFQGKVNRAIELCRLASKWQINHCEEQQPEGHGTFGSDRKHSQIGRYLLCFANQVSSCRGQAGQVCMYC